MMLSRLLEVDAEEALRASASEAFSGEAHRSFIHWAKVKTQVTSSAGCSGATWRGGGIAVSRRGVWPEASGMGQRLMATGRVEPGRDRGLRRWGA